MVFFFLSLTPGQTFSEEKPEDTHASSLESKRNEIIVSGKLFCSVNRKLLIPFNGTILSLNSRSGEKVRAGDVLARYHLEPEDALKLHKRLLSFDINELELKLAENNKMLAYQENKYKEIRRLSAQEMAPPDSLAENEREIELLKKKKKYYQERLPVERRLAEEERAVVEGLLGNVVKHGHTPIIGALKAPIDCHVIWVHPNFRKGAEFKEGTAVFSLGVMDPVLIRAQVHEIEAVQLNIGDVAELSLESIPGRKFEASVSRISWETLTPQLDKPSYYEVEFEVPNPEFILREGLRGRIILR
jgi:multidrug resistance efflux pump